MRVLEITSGSSNPGQPHLTAHCSEPQQDPPTPGGPTVGLEVRELTRFGVCQTSNRSGRGRGLYSVFDCGGEERDVGSSNLRRGLSVYEYSPNI